MKLSDKKETNMNDLDNLIRLAKIVAKPWCICTWVLAILLAISLGINAYLIVNSGVNLDLYADGNIESDISQHNE